MFTGIIENLGFIKSLKPIKDNLQIEITSSLSKDLKIDQSVSHNGVCLTIIKSNKSSHVVVAVKETLQCTNLSHLKQGDLINLERAIRIDSRIDGHFVSGHVDCCTHLLKLKKWKGSHELYFKIPKDKEALLIDKGSITINGISLTIAKLKKNQFSVAIIPYTWEHTNLKYLKPGDSVNLEFDLIGKYILRSRLLKSSK